MILPTIIGELIFWSPIIVSGIIAIIFPWFWSVVASIYFIWVLILPAIPIQIAFILLTAKIINKIRSKCND